MWAQKVFKSPVLDNWWQVTLLIMLIITMILVRISRMKLMLVMRIVIMLIIMPQFLTTGGADHDDHISIRKMLMIIISMVI